MIVRWLTRLVFSAIALYITSLILNNLFPPNLSKMVLAPEIHGGAGSWGAAALAILCLSLVNSLVRPIVRLLSLPLTLLTLGLSSLVINAALFWAVGYFTGGYVVEGIVALFLGPIILGFVTGMLSFLVKE